MSRDQFFLSAVCVLLAFLNLATGNYEAGTPYIAAALVIAALGEES